MEMIDGPIVPLEQVGEHVPFDQPPALLELPAITDENLDTRYLDGRRWMLLEEFDFASATLERIIRVPADFVTDFASIPRPLWPFLPPTGRYGKAAVLHDWLYRTARLATRLEADDVLMEAMIALSVDWITRQIIYRGVRVFGASSFHGSEFVAP